MKRRKFILLVVFGLLAGVNIPNSASATNYPTLAGKKCVKLGAKTIYYSTTFTCIRVGKNLVWNKGKPLMAVPLKPSR
jgi:hypothetical protein